VGLGDLVGGVGDEEEGGAVGVVAVGGEAGCRVDVWVAQVIIDVGGREAAVDVFGVDGHALVEPLDVGAVA